MDTQVTLHIQENENIINRPNSGQQPHLDSKRFLQQKVPIVKIQRNYGEVKLIKSQKGQGTDYEFIARGQLIDLFRLKGSKKQNKKQPYHSWENRIENYYQSDFIDFVGDFKGVFQRQTNQSVYYFEGKITNLTVLKKYRKSLLAQKSHPQICPQREDPQQQPIADSHQFKGYFRGIFIARKYQEDQSIRTYASEERWNEWGTDLVHEYLQKKIEYHVPTLVRMDVSRITSINLENSSAQIAAMLKIDIQLNQEIVSILQKDQEINEKGLKTKKHKLTVDTHRGKPLVLPFYDPEQFQETDEEEQYEWDDVWEGIDLQVEWDKQLLRMSYRIRSIYTAEIDNAHGMFFSPFNLNVLKIIVDIHSIKIKSNKICFNCCQLTDFNNEYNPYTHFNDLQRDLNEKQDYRKRYKKHIDRWNKIDTTHFLEQGQFSIADNRLALFPYHKRILKNKNSLRNLGWFLGITNKEDMISHPQVRTIKQSFQRYLKPNGEVEDLFSTDQWQFVHIEIPIFKYPAIDIIRIFVPIIILSAISLSIFWQESAKDYSGMTELAKRIASGCGLTIAYVALIPLIRSNLPPSPSITLVEILIYLSVIPNILAIISTLINTQSSTDQFFRTFLAFIDPFFLVSFVICCVSLIVFTAVLIGYIMKNYKRKFSIRILYDSPLENMRAPKFLQYIQKLKEHRKQYTIISVLEDERQRE